MALYLYNGNEYLEGMLGAVKARAASFNVNYRYVADELRYLFTNAATKAIIYHASLAATLADVLPDLAGVEVLLQVADESGVPLLPGAVDYEEALASAEGPIEATPTPGRPVRAVHRRDHRHAQGRAVAPARHLHRRHGRTVPSDLGHGHELRGVGGAGGRGHGSQPRASAADARSCAVGGRSPRLPRGRRSSLRPTRAGSTRPRCGRTVERERATRIVTVGDAMGRPLVEALEAGRYDTSFGPTVGQWRGGAQPSDQEALLGADPGADDRRRHGLVGVRRPGQSPVDGRRGEHRDVQAWPGHGDRRRRAGSPAAPQRPEHRMARPGRLRAARLPRRPGEDREDVSDHRRGPVRGRRRPGTVAAQRGDRDARARLRHDQLRGREDLRGGGRAGHRRPPRRPRRRRRRPTERALGARGRGARRPLPIPASPPTSSPSTHRRPSLATSCPKEWRFVPHIQRSPSGKADYRWAKQQVVDHADVTAGSVHDAPSSAPNAGEPR